MSQRDLVFLDNEALMSDLFLGGCFTSVSEFSRLTHISLNTMKKIRSGGSVREATVLKIVSGINAARIKYNATANGDGTLPQLDGYADWLAVASAPASEGSAEIEGGIQRVAHGDWRVIATDLEIPGHFDYANGPKQLGITLRVTQNGRTLAASGIDSDGDPVECWEAEFSEDWSYISGRHAIRSPHVHLAGVFFVKHMGLRMKGYYIQRDTDHESDLVFGGLELEFLGDPNEHRQ